MPSVTVSIEIPRSPAEVFDVAADPEIQLKWDQGTLLKVEKLTQEPLGKGSRYRGKFKGMGTVEYEFAEFDRPRRFSHAARIMMGEIRHVFTFEPVVGGTKLIQEGKLKPNLPGMLFGFYVKRMLKKRFRIIGAELTSYLARQPKG